MDRRAAFLASLTLHLTCVAVAIVMLSRGRPAATVSPQSTVNRGSIVWLNEAGPGGGGGGGGDDSPQLSRRAEARGTDRTTLPVVKKQTLESVADPKKDPEPAAGLDIPTQSLASSPTATMTLIGTIDGPPGGLSRGPGDGSGADGGKGDGVGKSPGNGLGDGQTAGIGDGPYQPGAGITGPIALYRETPRYTVEALRAHVQGSVLLQCIVQITGTCTNVRILRSPQPSMGLEQEAATAAMHWKFDPARRMGEAVPVQITMELAFAIH